MADDQLVALELQNGVDITAKKRSHQLGSLHPLTIAYEEMVMILKIWGSPLSRDRILRMITITSLH